MIKNIKERRRHLLQHHVDHDTRYSQRSAIIREKKIIEKECREGISIYFPNFINHNVGWPAKHTPLYPKTSNRSTTTVPLAPKIMCENAQDFEKLRKRRIKFTECKEVVHDDEHKIQDDIHSCFREFLSVKNLLLGEISLSSSDDVLQSYIDFETVLEKANEISTLSKRLGHGRRVYSLNHPLLGAFPL